MLGGADCPAGHTRYRQFVGQKSDRAILTAKLADASVRGASIGDRIRSARERAGLNKSELAAQAGVTYRMVHAWETGEKDPSAESLRRMSGVLAVSIEELLGVAEGQDPPFAAWTEFVKTPQGQSMTTEERRMLQSIAWPAGQQPTVAAYMVALSAARATVPRA